VLRKIRTSFIEELIKQADTWRVLRVTTLFDIIVVNYSDYLKTGHSSFLIDLFNNCIKIKLLNIFGNFDMTKSIDNLNINLNKESLLLRNIINESGNNRRNNDDLFTQIQYLKVICQIEVSKIDESLIDSIAIAVLYTLNVLPENN
jgi:hypothetical protein